jgi:nitrogen fixation/metabolism regulation signal transduction histidine kinase
MKLLQSLWLSGAKSSLEYKLHRYFFCWSALNLLFCATIGILLDIDALSFFTLFVLVFAINFWLWRRAHSSVLDVLERLGTQVDAFSADEFNTWHLANYNSGRVASLKSDFQRFAERLELKKQEYLQTEEFVFGFIEQLKVPIVVLDHHEQFYLANKSFVQLQGKTSDMLLGYSVHQLGLAKQTKDKSVSWHGAENRTWSGEYQIVEHQLSKSGQPYRLLVMFSVEQTLREKEKQVWQKLFRVLNHEVRNSLTPIYSMSQSLQELKARSELTEAQQNMERDMLKVIESRALQLMQFVDSYSVFNRLDSAVKQSISMSALSKRLCVLFPQLVVNTANDVQLDIDIGQVEQALINLIKNALEADESNNAHVEITWQQTMHSVVISITDSGRGISNPDNLFVPFYTTKKDGSGIGLLLSRELIRNQGGDLTLTNRLDNKGSVATITLPFAI